jgi:hypothetical protein
MLPWIELSATSTALIESHSDFLVSLWCWQNTEVRFTSHVELSVIWTFSKHSKVDAFLPFILPMENLF